MTRQQRTKLKQQAVEMYRNGDNLYRIIEELDLNRSTLRRWLSEAGVYKARRTLRMEYIRNWRERMREFEYGDEL